MSWLSPLEASIEAIEMPRYPPLLPSRNDVISVARTVAPGADDEPLVAVETALPTEIPYERLPLPARGPVRLRAEVLRRLARADTRLPTGFRLVVLDGWRSLAFQEALLAYYRARQPELGAGFVADAADGALIPPHVTGGAVDLTLSWHGTPLALGTDYDAFCDAARPEALESPGSDATARDLRRMLAAVLRSEGFASYPLEWWHWSFGDQIWAAERGLQVARYGASNPAPASDGLA